MADAVNPVPTDPELNVPHMNLEPLEEFAVMFALTLTGLQEKDEEVEPLTAQQLVVSMMSALSAFARTRPDYNPETNVSSVLQLGINTYAQALYSSASAMLDQWAESIDPEELEEEDVNPVPTNEPENEDISYEPGAEANLSQDEITDAFAALDQVEVEAPDEELPN